MIQLGGPRVLTRKHFPFNKNIDYSIYPYERPIFILRHFISSHHGSQTRKLFLYFLTPEALPLGFNVLTAAVNRDFQIDSFTVPTPSIAWTSNSSRFSQPTHERADSHDELIPLTELPKKYQHSKPQLERSHGFYNPVWLRRNVLLGFAVLYLSILVAVIVLYYVSRRHHGLSTQISTNQYSWTYGPTAGAFPVPRLFKATYD